MRKKCDFETAIKRLEQVTEKLERGDLTLEESLSLFEEGINLTNKCSKLLDEAEGKIKVMVRDLNDKICFKDFDGGNEEFE
jgi:exodeoxyribonuclease VII small subunit